MIIAPALLIAAYALEAPASTARPVTSLAGEWRVAAIDGHPIDAPIDIKVRADLHEIWWEPRCAGYAQSYHIRGAQFSTRRSAAFKRKPGDRPGIICTIAPPLEIAHAFTALASATRIDRTPDAGVQLSGGGHSLMLVSP